MTCKLDGSIDAIAEGLRAPALQARLDELQSRRAALEHELEGPPAPVLRLHPNLSQLYRRKIEDLQQALNHPETCDEAIAILRGLMEGILIGPVEAGLEVEVIGEIARTVDLGLRTDETPQGALDERTACSVKVVAGARNQRCLHLDYATLSLSICATTSRVG